MGREGGNSRVVWWKDGDEREGNMKDEETGNKNRSRRQGGDEEEGGADR